MTIRPMKRAVGAVLLIAGSLALLLPACGSGEDTDASQEAAAAQSKLLDDALQQIEALQQRTDELEAEMAAVADERDRAVGRVDRVRDRLWSALAKLREDISAAKASAGSASSAASSAAANAGAAVRDLTILENRFEYHLRRHGGG